MSLWLPVLLPIAVASIGYFLKPRAYRLLVLSGQIAQVAIVTAIFASVRSAGTIRTVTGSWPAGVGIALEADLLSSTLMMLAAWLFLLLLLYNTRKQYMNNLFQFLFVILQSLMIGLFLSGDLFNIYVLLELTTLVVGVLIMFKRDKQTLYDGMLYLMMNLASMTFMLLGIGFVYRQFGTLDLVQLAARIPRAADSRSLILPFSLVITGLGMKGALILLFSWLPAAHGAPSAPSVVSAALSGVQVKAGVYLLARWLGIFADSIPVEEFFLAIGFLTAITGVILAANQPTLKLVLAYSTVSQVGLILIGLVSGTASAYWGSVLHIVTHGVAKTVLFLTAGVVIHAYGTKQISSIRGVLRKMPGVGLAMAMGILAIIGAPVFSGGVSKYLIQGSLRFDPVYLGMLVINLGTTVTFLRFGRVLFGPVPESALNEGQPDAFTTSVTVMLAAACLLIGVFAEWVISVSFGVSLDVSAAIAPSKLLVFAATVGVGFVIARLLPAADTLGPRIERMRFAFPNVMLLVTGFFAATLAYLVIAG